MSLASQSAPQTAGVAGMFYPAEAEALAAGVDASLARAKLPALEPKAVIAPHAGHIYSGDIAGSAYGLLARRRGESKRVVLLGPTHRLPVRGLALSPADRWETPLGTLAVDTAARDRLAAREHVTVAPEPFAGEHSLEVHLPFIQRALGEVEVLPILVGQPAPGQVSETLERLWGGPEPAIVDTSDPRDRVVGYGSFAFEYAHSARLDDGARKTLFDLAREVVRQAALHGGKPPNVN